MADAFEDVRRTLLHLQRQIDRLSSRPIGPVSIGPGQGSIRMVNSAGVSIFSLTPEATMILQGGSLVNLADTLAAKAAVTYVDQVKSDLNTAIGLRATREYVDGNIRTLVEKNSDQDTAIAARATRAYVDGNISTLVQKNSAQDTAINARPTKAYVDNADSSRALNSSVASAFSQVASQINSLASRIRALEVQGNIDPGPGGGGYPNPY